MITDPPIATELAGYRIETLVGRGGMSVVYLAEDSRLKRRVALKLLARSSRRASGSGSASFANPSWPPPWTTPTSSRHITGDAAGNDRNGTVTAGSRAVDRPHTWCDAHHIIRWADGGPTALPNLLLLCRRHHRMVHERGGFRLELVDGRPVFRRPDGSVLEERAPP